MENNNNQSVTEVVEDYISYFERIVGCICETCDKQKPEDFNYLLEFLHPWRFKMGQFLSWTILNF